MFEDKIISILKFKNNLSGAQQICRDVYSLRKFLFSKLGFCCDNHNIAFIMLELDLKLRYWSSQPYDQAYRCRQKVVYFETSLNTRTRLNFLNLISIRTHLPNLKKIWTILDLFGSLCNVLSKILFQYLQVWHRLWSDLWQSDTSHVWQLQSTCK